MLIWIKGRVKSPSPCTCPKCEGEIGGEANILLQFVPEIPHETNPEPPKVRILKVCCDGCMEAQDVKH